jgi:arylsulfatase A-like enzyme
MATVGKATKTRPNFVYILADNVGWGDFSCYGGSTATPRIDKLASEGIRFTNYTVESQCTPTRTAIMTGRESVRCGTYKVVMPGQGETGLVPWEYTIAELLSDAGYATSLWGKWHLGETEGRLPNDQGFDEWWGYKNSVDEAGWTSCGHHRITVLLEIEPFRILEAVVRAHGKRPPAAGPTSAAEEPPEVPPNM